MKCIFQCSVPFPALGFKGPSSNKYQDHHSVPQHMAAAYFDVLMMTFMSPYGRDPQAGRESELFSVELWNPLVDSNKKHIISWSRFI